MLKCRKIYIKQFDDNGSDRILYLPCNQWKCDICRKNKIRDLKSELNKSVSEYVNNIGKNGFRNYYSVKLLTLTWPGSDRRSPLESKIYNPHYTGVETIKEACKEIKKNFHKLMQALKYKYGDYRYLCFMEPQSDGYPHLHILLMGGGVGSRLLLNDIKKLWFEKYEMGKQINLQVVKFGIKAGISYILKYLHKMQGMTFEGSRLWSVDRALLNKKEIKQTDDKWTTYEIGSVYEDGLGKISLWAYWDISLTREWKVEYTDIVPF